MCFQRTGGTSDKDDFVRELRVGKRRAYYYPHYVERKGRGGRGLVFPQHARDLQDDTDRLLHYVRESTVRQRRRLQRQ